MKFIKLGYSVITYLFFLAVFTYLVIFLGAGFLTEWIPFMEIFKTVDSGSVNLAVPLVPAWISNLILLLAFSVHHSVMARLGVKEIVNKFIPQSAERSTFVLATCLILCWMYLAWQPQASIVWAVDGGLKIGLVAVFLAGAGLVLWATFMISHWRLFGLQQAWQAFTGIKGADDEFSTPALYKYSRHPMYVGVLMVLWATPVMTSGHLMLAVTWTIYVLIGIYFEEKDLVHHFGDRYREYQRSVAKLVPIGFSMGKHKSADIAATTPVKSQTGQR